VGGMGNQILKINEEKEGIQEFYGKPPGVVENCISVMIFFVGNPCFFLE
jgi:hypothetical protein